MGVNEKGEFCVPKKEVDEQLRKLFYSAKRMNLVWGLLGLAIGLAVGISFGFYLGHGDGWQGAIYKYEYKDICTLDSLVPGEALRLELDLNQARVEGFQQGYLAGYTGVFDKLFEQLRITGSLDLVVDANGTVVRLVPQGACQAEREALLSDGPQNEGDS